MNGEIGLNRSILLKTIYSLGYRKRNDVLVDDLAEITKSYTSAKELGIIRDFAVIPHKETDLEGLSEELHYVFWVQR